MLDPMLNLFSIPSQCEAIELGEQLGEAFFDD
jgi:hypothetical protein